jgi:nucleoside-diphosphate-sugar epimerase
MRLIITGGAGFIGTALVAALQATDHTVRVVDTQPPTPADLPWDQASVLDAPAMQAVICEADAVIHLAGGVRDVFRRDPYSGSLLQVQGTLNVLEACRRNAVPHLLLASSFYVYQGLSAGQTVDEGAPLNGHDLELFAAAKLMAESCCREYTRKYGVRHTILRFGSAYGAGGSNAVRSFLETGLRAEVFDIWGAGRRRNQYTFVDDIARGTVAALACPNETFNLVSPEVTTTAELAALLHREWGFHAQFDPARPEEPDFPYMVATKAHERLQWQPTPLAAGLAHTVRALQAARVPEPLTPRLPVA